jgi:hypothetical protein
MLRGLSQSTGRARATKSLSKKMQVLLIPAASKLKRADGHRQHAWVHWIASLLIRRFAADDAAPSREDRRKQL